nr:MAG TPA: NifQ [Caudoviricetes sp.]
MIKWQLFLPKMRSKRFLYRKYKVIHLHRK